MNEDLVRISDERLFIKYAEGDTAAFRILMERYAGRLRHYCRGFVSSEHEAEDLVQDTFLRAIRSAATYRATSRFSTWIYTIARNLCLDLVRIQGTRNDLLKLRQEQIAETTLAASQPVPGSDDPEIDTAVLKEALELLTPLEAETIRLTFQANWTTQQIAELQKCSRATVRTRRFQALEKMRQVLQRNPVNKKDKVRTE